MAQNFIGVDRDQVFLMPPSLRDWLAVDHLVWTVLESVDEMDLTAFYAAYRADGHGRPAYDPSMMVALLLYAYSQANRSSRRIERECREDVAYRVIAANRAPDHSTIAEFRCRHERAIADLFGEVLGLCRAAGMVNVGVIAVDGTKVHANASNMANRDYRQIALEILKEADRIDREEDELYGEARGDELPEHLRTPEGRRAALKEAKRRLERERAERDRQSNCAADEDRGDEDDQDLGAGIELDPEVIVARVQGRQGWSREAKRQLDSRREEQPRPVPASRIGRLLIGEHKLSEDLASSVRPTAPMRRGGHVGSQRMGAGGWPRERPSHMFRRPSRTGRSTPPTRTQRTSRRSAGMCRATTPKPWSPSSRS
jgi:transposase